MELSDIIDAILFKCVEARGYYQDIGVLADSVAGRVLSDSEKNDIEREIVDSGLLDQVSAGWGANAKTREICKNGGYVKYITAIDKEQKIRHKAQTARDRKDIFDFSTRWYPYIISTISIILSILAIIRTLK